MTVLLIPPQRLLLLLALCLTVLASSSCGCSTDSNGPPVPDDDYTPPPANNYWQNDHYYRGSSWNIQPLEDSWLTNQRLVAGDNFLEDFGSQRVEKLSESGIEYFGLAVFRPAGPADLATGAGLELAAYAAYKVNSRYLGDKQLYLELDWTGPPGGEDTVLVGLRRSGRDAVWDWYTLGPEMQLALLRPELYRTNDKYQSIYVAVLVSGYRACTLSAVALRQYRR